MTNIPTISTNPTLPLHSLRRLRRRHFNRLFAVIYTSAILCLLHHHILTLLHPPTLPSFFISLSFFISDILLAYIWSTTQACRMNPVHRKVFPENLDKILDRKDFPALDIFICTADPYKEPPIDVVNTALSVMAYDYPPEKISVYVSDDGGSELTLFAFMEAAKFAKQWLGFCREKNIVERSPHAYFSSNHVLDSDNLKIKMMYEDMKIKVENAIEKGKISCEYISSQEELQIFSQYCTKDFTRHNHPPIIQVLLKSDEDRDVSGLATPNLVYVSREKNKATPHHFKAGALNALLRVSGVMTNSPIVLTLDCDMFSNDPLTIQRFLCCISDQSSNPNCGYVQFPQRFHGINKDDIYACAHKRLYTVNPIGMDGLDGPCYVGSGCFFLRRVFFGGPNSCSEPEIPELSPDYVADKFINGKETLGLAHDVAKCNYEDGTIWGSKMGFRYWSLSEDFFTGYQLQCEGWKAVFCNPTRPAFLGDVPISLNDALSQTKRWIFGLLEVGFSKYSPLIYGTRTLGILMGLSYGNNAYWSVLSVSASVYAFLPSLTLLNAIPIFPKMNEPYFLLYVFLFLGAYAQDCVDYISYEGTFRRWWNDQRMWLIRGLTSYLFGSIEYINNFLGLSSKGFNVTSKVMNDEQRKRYDQGIFEFGVPSPMFVPLTMAAILNLLAFLVGFAQIFKERSFNSFFAQIFIAGFGVLNSLPIYEAMVLRKDKGRMPTKTVITSILLVGLLYAMAYFMLG